MSIILKESSNTENKRELVSPGTHIARCYQMINVGTLEYEFKGETTYLNKTRLTFELPNEIRDFGGEDKPMVISKLYTTSLHEKSNLRKDLEGWRGKQFTSKELRGFDLADLLGKECYVSVIHKTGQSGSDYAAINAISAMPKGVECPKQFNASFMWNYTTHFDQDWVEQQPEWIQVQIKSTDEYKSKLNELKYKDKKSDDDLPF